MPVNKNAMTRYKIIDDLLSNRYHSYTFDDIVENVNLQLVDMGIKAVTRRCVEKDLAYLKGENSSFFAEVEAYSVEVYNGERTVKKRCLRYKDPSFSIFKKEMSDEECYLLEQSLSLLGQFEGLPNLEELQRLRMRLRSNIGRQIVSFSKNSLENNSVFARLFSAITQKQVISMTYHKFDAPKDRLNILFHPYLLKEYNKRWYIFGIADDDHNVLCFSLDRIDALTPLPGEKYIEYSGQLDGWFDDIIGVTRYKDAPVRSIVFWVSDVSKDYVLTKPIHESQVHYKNEKRFEMQNRFPHLKGGEFFCIKCIENFELLRELTSFGENLLVLSPSDIRDKIFAKIQLMFEKYSELRK